MGLIQGRKQKMLAHFRERRSNIPKPRRNIIPGDAQLSMETLLSMMNSQGFGSLGVPNIMAPISNHLVGSVSAGMARPSMASAIEPSSSIILPSSTTMVKAGKPTISISIERGNRMAIRWPVEARPLTDFLTQKNETASSDDLIGAIQTLNDGTNKKLIPLYIQSAEKVHKILKGLKTLTHADDKPIYKVAFDAEYTKWYTEASKSRGVLVDSGGILKLDDDKVQTSHPFLKIPLYPWQTKAFLFMNAITETMKVLPDSNGRLGADGLILADDTGLGKTIEVAAHLASKGYKAVVACPKSLVHLWKRKIEMCSHLTVAICDADYPSNIDTFDVIIVSYSYLKRFAPWPLAEIIQTQQRVFVTDEGHMVRNPDAVRTAMSQMLAHLARHTVVVTATPLVNRVGELHSLLKMCRRNWTEASQKDFIEMYGSEDGQKELAKELKKFMVRRLTHEVWKDAPKGEVGEAWVKLTNRTAYDEAEADFIAWLMRQGVSEEKLASAERGRALVKLNYLRQLSAHGKVSQAIHLLDQTLSAGEQVVLFSAYNDPILHLVNHFASKTGTNHKGQQWSGAEMITGTVNDKNRLRIVDGFEAGKIGLLCVGVKAGGFGIDLPAACYAYFLDLPWTPADFTQATGRLLRLGQKRNCQFIKLLAQNTIDQRMEEIIQGKADIFARTIDDADFKNRVTAMDSTKMHDTIVSSLIASYMNAA
jgi:SWI/SNF-related matrix-associated actin-dependent regulator 1 of chromatin subfamily A